MTSGKPRVLVFIVAYNAEKTIAKVVARIPESLLATYEVDVLIIDDSSRDRTFATSHHVSRNESLPFHLTVLFNPVNQGYGGNQKIGYRYAIEHGYDFVALVHGDGQYAPECLPELLEPLRAGRASAVFGSRMLTPTGALKGGMPLYKFAGNKVLTWIENRLLKSNLSEFHSGYRLYATRALAAIPLDRNANDFHFDTEIIIQFFVARLKIEELPIPTYYGDEICHVNGMKYALNVVIAALKRGCSMRGFFTTVSSIARHRTIRPTSRSSGTRVRIRWRWSVFGRDRACSISAAPELTSALCWRGRNAASSTVLTLP